MIDRKRLDGLAGLGAQVGECFEVLAIEAAVRLNVFQHRKRLAVVAGRAILPGEPQLLFGSQRTPAREPFEVFDGELGQLQLRRRARREVEPGDLSGLRGQQIAHGREAGIGVARVEQRGRKFAPRGDHLGGGGLAALCQKHAIPGDGVAGLLRPAVQPRQPQVEFRVGAFRGVQRVEILRDRVAQLALTFEPARGFDAHTRRRPARRQQGAVFGVGLGRRAGARNERASHSRAWSSPGRSAT